MHTEDCERPTEPAEEYQPIPVHHARRVLPCDPVPAQAWIETEDLRSGTDSTSDSPGENKRLLGKSNVVPKRSSGRIQAGLTLGVWESPKSIAKYPTTPKFEKAKAKTKFQKKKKQIVKLLKPPYFILSMILIIVSIHLLMSDQLRSMLEWSPSEWWRQPWRLFTYGCLHASGVHLALNAVVALAVGWPLEREQSWRRVVAVWAGGVAAGALGAGVLQPHVRVVGASAAVYALLTAHIANVCLRYGHIPLWWFRPLSVLVLVSSELCWTLAQSHSPGAPGLEPAHAAHASNSSDQVAWAAHLFGGLCGVPLAFLVFSGENEGKRYIWVCRVASAALLLAWLLLAALFTCWFDAL